MNPISFFEQSKLKPFHILLVFWLFIIMMFEGYDVVIYGATIPFLKESWGISDMIAGSIGSYTTMGTAAGAVLFGLYSDRFGRKRIIILTTMLFSIFTHAFRFCTECNHLYDLSSDCRLWVWWGYAKYCFAYF